MALNVQKTLIDQAWALLEAREGFTSVVKEADRVKTSDHLYPEWDAARKEQASGYPRVGIYCIGSTSLKPTLTFCSTVDAGQPGRVDLEVKVLSDQLQDSVTMALETEMEAAFYSAGDQFGIPWVSYFEWRKPRATRRQLDVGGRPLRGVATYTLTFHICPMRSELTAE